MTPATSSLDRISPKRVAVGALGIAGALLVLALLPGPWMPDNVQAAGDWFSGLGAVAVLVWAVEEHRREQRRDDKREAAIRINQARSVVLYGHQPQVIGALEPSNDSDVWEFSGRVGNFGPGPIRNVRLHAKWAVPGVRRARAELDPVYDQPVGWFPDHVDLAVDELGIAEVIEPFGSAAVPALRFAVPWVPGRPHPVVQLSVSFYDVHGDRWTGVFGTETPPGRVALAEAADPFWSEDLRRLAGEVSEPPGSATPPG